MIPPTFASRLDRARKRHQLHLFQVLERQRDDRKAHVGVHVRAAVAGEVLGHPDHAAALQALDVARPRGAPPARDPSRRSGRR